MYRWFLLLAAASWVVSAQSGAPGIYAIKNATIHPASGPVIAGGTVVVRDGLIEAVGSSVKIPSGAWEIDAKGMHVYPGLIDSLSQWGLPATPVPAAPAGGGRNAPVVTVRPGGDATEPNVQFLDDGGPEDRPSTTSWLKAADLILPGDRAVAAARNAGFTTAFVFPSAGILAGQGSAMNLAGEKPGEMVVSSPIGQYVSLAVRGFTGFPGSLMGSIAYVRQVYLDTAHYKEAKAMYAQNPRGLQRPVYDRALEGILESPRILLPASRLVEIDRMIRFGKELNTPVVLYGGAEAWRSASSLKKAGVPVLINLRWPEPARDGDPDAQESLRTLETRELAPSGPAELAKAGVRFAFYSGGIDRPSDLRRAVRRAIDAGLSREDALRAMTLNAAQIFGLDDRLGSIETGKIANLTITEGEWFDDRSRVKYVFVDGKKFEPAPETPAAEGARATSGGE